MYSPDCTTVLVCSELPDAMLVSAQLHQIVTVDWKEKERESV